MLRLFRIEVFHGNGTTPYHYEECRDKAQFLLVLAGLKAEGTITGWNENTLRENVKGEWIIPSYK